MNIVIYIYDGMTMLDAIGPYEVLRAIPNATIKFVAEAKGEVYSDSKAVFLNAKYAIDEIESADILVVPGSGTSTEREIQKANVLTWIKKIDQTTQWTTSVCSGSLILAATGILRGLKATCHWMLVPTLADFGSIPVRDRVVKSGKYLTAAGVSAGVDMGLYLANVVAGEKQTRAIQLMIEYDPKPIFDSGNYEVASPEVIKLATARLLEDAF